MKQILWCKQCAVQVAPVQGEDWTVQVLAHLEQNPTHQIQVFFVKEPA